MNLLVEMHTTPTSLIFFFPGQAAKVRLLERSGCLICPDRGNEIDI
jgi:hypothetical protein